MVRTVDLRKTLTDPKPLYAMACMGDLAVGKLRARLAALRGDLKQEPKATQHRVRHGLETLQHDVAELPSRGREFARDRLGQANHGYDDLAARGEQLVGRLSPRKPTQELVEQSQTTIRRARATRATARAGAERTTRAARATGAKARKAAEPAATAGGASAEKIGD